MPIKHTTSKPIASWTSFPACTLATRDVGFTSRPSSDTRLPGGHRRKKESGGGGVGAATGYKQGYTTTRYSQ